MTKHEPSMAPKRPDVLLPMSLGVLATLGAAAAMVIVRGQVDSAVTALVLAAVVAGCARSGGRYAGVASALMAAVSYDFFHTVPYLSLKINSGDQILVTVLLFVVGMVVGGLSTQAEETLVEAQVVGDDAASVRRVLEVATKGDSTDTELSVRAELQQLLSLQACDFTTHTTDLPLLGRNGSLPEKHIRYQPEGFELPVDGFALSVEAFGHHFGQLECKPVTGVGVHTMNRRTAVALAEVLGLVLAASSPPPPA